MEDVQRLENDAEIRIKFASINDRGGYDGDAWIEYQKIFPDPEGELPGGWRYQDVGMVMTRFENTRTAYRLKHADLEEGAAAVEHETGLELVLIGVASGVATAAVVGLSKWLWKKWQESRPADSLPPSIIVERVTEWKPDGTILRSERYEVRGPLENEDAGKLLEQAFQES